jgi:uncharacterized protein (DUF885 family)
MSTGAIRVIVVVLFIGSPFSCTSRAPEIDYDYTAEGDAQLADLVTRYYRPTEQENERLRGMNRTSFKAWAERSRAFLQELESTIAYDALDVSGQIDYDYFRAQLDNSILMIEDLRRWEKSPSMYIPFNAFFVPSLDLERPWEERFEEMIEGLENDLDRFERGKENLDNPPLLWTESSIEDCDYVSLYLNTSLPDIINQAPTEALKNRMTAAAEKYRAALEDYRQFLATNLRPRSRGSYAVGEEVYNRLLTNHFMNYTVEELIAIGEREIENNLKLLEETAREIDPSKTWDQLLRENWLDHVAPWDLFDDLKQEKDRAKKIVYEQLVNVPPGLDAEYRYAKEAHYNTIAQGQSGIGPITFTHGNKYIGYFAIPYIDHYETMDRKSIFMRDWNRSWYIAQHIPHEVYPGHFFESFMQKKNMRPARLYAGSAPFTSVRAAFAEGWGVYSEEVMADLGYFQGDKRMYLSHLGHRMWRIARILIDPKMHSRGMSYDEAHRFFMSIGLTAGQAHVETSQVTIMPVHDAAYYIGKLEILALREEYKELKGNEFDFKHFHTQLLLLGGTPPLLARREMIR